MTLEREQCGEMDKRILYAIPILFGGVLMLWPETALALPAFARQYGVDCATCHSPAVPRLNADGHRFRKRGYRFAEDWGQPRDVKNVSNFVAFGGRFQPTYTDPDEGQSKFEFGGNEASFYYAGAVTSKLTGFFEVGFQGIDEVELNGFVGWYTGTTDHWLGLRLGQMDTLPGVGWAGFDRPTGITTTAVLSSKLTTTPVPFTVDQGERGLEVAYNFTPDVRVLGQVLNGLNFDGSGTEGSGDSDRDKDFLAAVEWMIGKNGSGVTVYGYSGTWHQEPGSEVSGIPLPSGDDFTEFDYVRYGVTGSLIVNLLAKPSELQAGVILARDDYPDSYPGASGSIDGRGVFVDVEQYLTHSAAVFVRADLIDPDIDTGGNDRTRYTMGGVYTPNDYLRLALEAFTENDDAGPDPKGAQAEVMINF
jgi:hypothetical protein